LARGVNELPEETRASAAAMRRVVAEQIEALSELNAIVRSQPATLDINERRPAPRQEQPAYQPRQPLVDPIRTAERPAQPAQPPRQPVFQGPAPQPARAAEPQPVIEAAAPQQPEAGGWLRDVLRNATAKQQSSQPQPGLSGLTEEI